MATSRVPGLAIAALAAVLAGCPLPPSPKVDELQGQAMPKVAVPDKWSAGLADPADVKAGWLAQFPDEELQRLVVEAMAYNADLRVAAARVEVAQASAKAAGAALLPMVAIGAKGGGKMSDGSGLEMGGLFANWEIDLWGRVRAEREVGSAQYESTALDAAYARESIAALVAKSWFTAKEATLLRAIGGEMVSSSEALAGLARDRLRIGKGDEYDVSQAEAGVLAYRDATLQADIARQQALRAIETLAGRYPAAALDPSPALPPVAGTIPMGLPSQLLERRPDVRAAERRVAAAFYGVTEAQAARLPRIALTASGSSVSSDLFFLKERDNPVWSVGANIMLPIFTGGALQAQVEARTAQQKAAVADYGRIGAKAFGEVEGALSTSFNLEARERVLADAVRANERAVGFARVRYDVGSGDLRSVQQQMLALHGTRTSLVRVQAERLIQRVNLHLALGGGFEAAPGAN